MWKRGVEGSENGATKNKEQTEREKEKKKEKKKRVLCGKMDDSSRLAARIDNVDNLALHSTTIASRQKKGKKRSNLNVHEINKWGMILLGSRHPKKASGVSGCQLTYSHQAHPTLFEDKSPLFLCAPPLFFCFVLVVVGLVLLYLIQLHNLGRSKTPTRKEKKRGTFCVWLWSSS